MYRMTSYNKLRARYVAVARELSPGQADARLDEAQGFLEHTAWAIDTVLSYAMSSMTEPAYTFAVDAGPSLAGSDAPASVPGPVPTNPLKGPGLPRDVTGTPPTVAAGDPSGLTILEAAAAIRKGDLSPVELVEACLARIETTESDVHAWETVLAEQAMAEARQAERELRAGTDLGPLHGIPFGVKDNIFTAGIRTSGGSRLFDGFVPSYDATVITLLKQAGAIVLGKTTTTEMALGDSPPTRNPWNLAHTPGGSSSGSAAAVAAGQVPFTLGTQTGGSLNRPTGYCGLVAIKPTFGRVSRYGTFPVGWTLDHIGAMTKTAADQALILQSLCRVDARDPSTFAAAPPLTRPAYGGADAAKRLRCKAIGRPDRYFLADLHPAQRAAYDQALRLFEDEFGMVVVDVELPPAFEAAAAAQTLIMQCEAAAVHSAALRERGHLIRPMLRSRILCGYATGAPEYMRAQQIRTVYIEQMRELFRATSIGILATPTTPSPAPEGIRETGSPAFNAPFTMCGFPTIVFPVGYESATNLPLSVQAVAPPWQEEILLDLAIAYQYVTDWHKRRPPGLR